jgi:hypothetical protein
MKALWNKSQLWQARRRGKAAAIRDWNSRLHLVAVAEVDGETPESDALLRDYILEGISWLDDKDRGNV